MNNEEQILKGLREIYKQNREILEILKGKEVEKVVAEAGFLEKPGESEAARLMRKGMESV